MIYFQPILILLFVMTVSLSRCQVNADENASVYQVKAALFLEKRNTSIYDEIHFRPAFDIALRKVNAIFAYQQTTPFNISYTFYSTGTGCGINGMRVVEKAAKILINGEVDVIFGPMCNDETISVADLAANFDVPMFAAFGTDFELLNKNRFKTYTRMSHTRDVAANFVGQIFLRFGWKACAIVWNQDKDYYKILVDELRDILEKYFVVVTQLELRDYSTTKEALLDAQRGARSKLINSF